MIEKDIADKIAEKIIEVAKREDDILSQFDEGIFHMPELDKFLSNKGNIRFVINNQQDYEEILLEYIDLLTKYHKNRIKYASLLNKLLPDFVYQ